MIGKAGRKAHQSNRKRRELEAVEAHGRAQRSSTDSLTPPSLAGLSSPICKMGVTKPHLPLGFLWTEIQTAF